MGRESGWNPLLKSYPFSEKVNAVSIGAEVLFCRLIAQADDYGNYYSDPRMILATLFPHRWAKREVSETDAGRWRAELVTCPYGPLVATYSVGGVEYLHVINARRRLRSDVTPEERFPREPATIEQDALSAHVTQAARRRTADVPLTYTLDEDKDQDKDEDQTKKKTCGALKLETPTLDSRADEVIDYLNASMNPPGRFRHSPASRQHILARLKDGGTVDDCKMIVDVKAAEWGGDPQWENKLRPKTLFTPEHFESYLNEAIRWNEQGRPRTGRNGKDKTQESLDNIAEWLHDKEAQRGKRASGSGGNGDGSDGIGAEVFQGGDGDLESSPSPVV